MSPADDLSETSPSPELEFLESTEDALGAFLAEETAGKPHSRGQRLAVRTAVLIAVCGSLAVVLILAVVTRSRWSGGGSLALIPAPSVVVALPERPRVPLPEPPRVPAAPVIAADLTPPNSGRQGPGTFKDDAISQLKPPIAPKTTTTNSPGRTALSGTSRQKSVVQSPQRGLPKLSPDANSQRRTSSTREATRNLIVPSKPVVSEPDHADTGSEAVRAASAAPTPSALSTYPARSDSPSAVVPPIAQPSPVSASITTGPPPNAVAASTAVNPAIGEELAVRNLLGRYRSAYESLNVDAAKGVWPSVNTRALSRAFDGLQSQEFNFSECQIRLDNNRATVTCGGTARFVPKVGNRSERIEYREWEFEMRKADDQWTIAKVQVR